MKKVSFFFALLILLGNFTIAQKNFPDWAKGIIWYQIFPERFANGDINNDPAADKAFANYPVPKGWKTTPWTSNWFATSDWEANRFSGKNDYTSRRYGGDIQGIINNLDYIKSLGVGAIYINPVFEAESMHKYDGSTYHHIDIDFGPDPEGDKKLIASETPDDPATWVWTSADKLFLKLIRETHNRGMRIIIDGVFNHTGVQFWAFQDIIKNQQKSKYKDWYKIKSFNDSVSGSKFDYKGWWNYKSLPEFNRTKENLNDGPKNYIINACKRWLNPNGNGDLTAGIDGWRLDVAREVPIGFWRDWSKAVKETNPHAIIIGELWELSGDFVGKDGPFDALMNYNFAFAVNNFIIADKQKIKTSEFIKLLEAIDTTYPAENLNVLQNLLDSHDTERLISLIKNPDRKYDSDADERNPLYNPAKPDAKDINKLKLVVAFQMAYRGAPMIYYGDEVGMWGADDPHDRKPMVWDYLKYDDEVIDSTSGFKTGLGVYKVEQNKTVLSFYKKIISIRNNNAALKAGNLKFIYSNDADKTFAFSRELNGEKIIAVFNVDKNRHNVKLNVKAKSLYNLMAEGNIKVKNNISQLKLEPESFLILKQK